jgi:uridine kinase
MNRIKITIEGPQGSGKTQIRRAIEAAVKDMGKSCKSFDPVYKFKPEDIDFGDAEVIVMVRQKNKPETASPAVAEGSVA